MPDFWQKKILPSESYGEPFVNSDFEIIEA